MSMVRMSATALTLCQNEKRLVREAPLAIIFNRIFETLDPDDSRQIFIQWIRDVFAGMELSDSSLIALDGISVKGYA